MIITILGPSVSKQFKMYKERKNQINKSTHKITLAALNVSFDLLQIAVYLTIQPIKNRIHPIKLK
jgi:hypothetical protein